MFCTEIKSLIILKCNCMVNWSVGLFGFGICFCFDFCNKKASDTKFTKVNSFVISYCHLLAFLIPTLSKEKQQKTTTTKQYIHALILKLSQIMWTLITWLVNTQHCTQNKTVTKKKIQYYVTAACIWTWVRRSHSWTKIMPHIYVLIKISHKQPHSHKFGLKQFCTIQ